MLLRGLTVTYFASLNSIPCNRLIGGLGLSSDIIVGLSMDFTAPNNGVPLTKRYVWCLGIWRM